MITIYEKALEFSKDKNYRIALAFGCFDILHSGHIDFLINIKKHTDMPLAIGVLDDDIIRKTKGKDRPVINEADRLKIVQSLKMVDFAFLVSETDFLANKDFNKSIDPSEAIFWNTGIACIETLNPMEFYLSNTFKMTESLKSFFNKSPVKSVLLPYKKNISTSSIIRKIRES